ncbi:MAG: carboxypeptidase-like regulatory domain-containing protein [Thermoproteota archaeon]
MVDDWGYWGSKVPYDTQAGKFGAVAYLFNATGNFDQWDKLGFDVADPNGWVEISIASPLKRYTWNCTNGAGAIDYWLLVKLTIAGVETPITIFNGSVVHIEDSGPSTPGRISLYDVLNKTTILGDYPGYTGIITSPNPANGTETVDDVTYPVYRMWLYYVALQALDEYGYPLAGASLEVRFTSAYDDLNGKTFIGNTKVPGWNSSLYGNWVANGTVGKEMVPTNNPNIFNPDYTMGWVVLRVPRINDTTGTTSSLVNNMTFLWRYKTGTLVNRTVYTAMEAPISPPFSNKDPGGFATYTGDLAPNATHLVEASVRWVLLYLTDCNGQNWWTMDAEVYAFDSGSKKGYSIPGMRVAPGRYLLRYPIPVTGWINLTVGVEWHFSTVHMSFYNLSLTDGVDELQEAGDGSPWVPDDVVVNPGGLDVDALANPTLECMMTWVSVSFWSQAELPQQPTQFAAQIWLPATRATRSGEPLTVWWWGVNGFLILPDMKYYVGPEAVTYDRLDPYGIAGTDFQDFWEAMSQSGGAAGGFGGQGWLPTREVGWTDFKIWYEGVLVLDTVTDGPHLRPDCCAAQPPYGGCQYNFSLAIYELGFHVIFDACGKLKDDISWVPFYFKHPSLGLIGPKAVTNGKVEIVKAPKGNYSDFIVGWQMSFMKPYRVTLVDDLGVERDLDPEAPIKLDGNMRNINLYFKLYNLTIEPRNFEDTFTLVNVYVRVFSESDVSALLEAGLEERQVRQIMDSLTNFYNAMFPAGWEIIDRISEEGKIYYATPQVKVTSGSLPEWGFLPAKDYWVHVNVSSTVSEAVGSGFRSVDANATLYWGKITLDDCYTQAKPYRLRTYVYDPVIALKDACGASLDLAESSAFILAEPWEDGELFSKQQVDPTYSTYNAYLVRVNQSTNGRVTIHSVNASREGRDPDVYNVVTGNDAPFYPQQSRYLIGRSAGGVYGPWEVKESKPSYRMLVYWKGVLVYNESTVLNNPYESTENPLTTSVYPYVFYASNSPIEKADEFGIPNVRVAVFWAGLNLSYWPAKHLAYETAPTVFLELNNTKGQLSFDPAVVQLQWGPERAIDPFALEDITLDPLDPANSPYFSSQLFIVSGVTGNDGRFTVKIPVWNYSVIMGATTTPLFGTPVYANFTTIPGETPGIPEEDIVRMVATLEEVKYCTWEPYAMNATGRVNPATDVWKATGCVSLNTTTRDPADPYGGVGLLVGGDYQGRVGEDAVGCYALAHVHLPVNDLKIVVRNVFGIGLPNQKVTVVREPIYVRRDGERESIRGRESLLSDYTPTVPNEPGPDYYVLLLKSSLGRRLIWGIYNMTVRAENLTRGVSYSELRIDDPQFITVRLTAGEEEVGGVLRAIPWESGTCSLNWTALLKVSIVTEDGRPIEKAWVYVVDAYTGGNATAALTDREGNAATLYVGANKAPQTPSLYLAPGDRVFVGFNLLKGWYWVDENQTLTGEAVNPRWNMSVNNPPQPIGDRNIQTVTYGGKTDLARFYGKYYVIVYYKPQGCDVKGPYQAEVVFNSFTAEAQYQYIYLGIRPDLAVGTADTSTAQSKKYELKTIKDLRIEFRDAEGRPLSGVKAVASYRDPARGISWRLDVKVEGSTGVLEKVPLMSGTSYMVEAEWESLYTTKARTTATVKDLYSVITLPVYDVKLTLLSERGTPLVGIPVEIKGVKLGVTDATGAVTASRIPAGTYDVDATWLGTKLELPQLVVSSSAPQPLTAKNVYLLAVRVKGAQGQALEGASVRVKKGEVEVVARMTDKAGMASVELPAGSYTVEAKYGEWSASRDVNLNRNVTEELGVDVFMELFGVGMSLAQFLLLIVMVIIIVLVLAIVIHEYHIYRRKRLPQLFGAPAAPK